MDCSPSELTALIKVGRGKWTRNIVIPNNRTFDIVCSETKCRRWRIDSGSCISVKNDPSSNIVTIKACLKNEKHLRAVQTFQLELLSEKDHKAFLSFLHDNSFIPATKYKGILVFVNPVSG